MRGEVSFMSPPLNAYSITRTLYKSNKYSLQLFIPPVETTEFGTTYDVSLNAVLFLALPYNKDIAKEMKKYRRFKIKPSNLKSLLRTFSTVLDWYYSDKYDDIFVENDHGVLVFNSDYKDLHAITERSYFEDNVIKIIPTRVEVAYQKYVEGVKLFVNRMENYVDLTIQEFEILYDLLDQFDFTTAVLLSYEALRHSVNTGKLVGEVELQRRRQMIGYYDNH